MAPESRSHWPLSILGGIVSLLNLFLPLTLVRILSPEEIGHYKIFFLYLVLVPWFFLTAGINNGLSHWSGHEHKRTAAFRASWTLLVMVSFFTLILGIVAMPALSHWQGWSTQVAWLFVWGAFVTLLGNFYDDSAVATGQIWRGAIFNAGFELVRNLGILAAAIHYRKLEMVFTAHVLAMTLRVALGLILGRSRGLQRLHWDPAILKPVLKYAFPVSLSAALAIITNYSDQLILSSTLLPADFAMYSLGCLTVPPLFIFEQSVNRVAIPRMSNAFAMGIAKRAMGILRDSISELSWILIPSAIGLFIFSDGVVKLLFTEKYMGASEYLRIAAFGYLNLMFPYDAVARAKGQGKWILRQLMFFSVFSVVLIYSLSTLGGAKGALIGVILGQTLMRVLSLDGIRRMERWSWSEMMPWADWGQYAAWAGIASLAGWSVKGVLGGGVKWLVVGGALFSLIYFFGTFSTLLRRRAANAEQPRVLLLTQYLGLGGLERMVLNLSRGLKDSGQWSPLVFVYDSLSTGITLHSEFERSGIPVITMRKKLGLSLKVVWKLAATIVRERVLVIHSHDLGALIYAVLAKFVTLGAVRVVHTQHSFIHLEKSERYKNYERFFSSFADELSTVSEGLKEMYRAVGVDPSRVSVIPNGVEFPRLESMSRSGRIAARRELLTRITEPSEAPRLGAMTDRIWVLCLARVHPKKGQEQVLKLWSALGAEERKKAVLVFVGAETFAGQLEKLRAGIAALPDSEEVLYAGFTQSPADWLGVADIALSGSEFEGMPLGPIESVGAGLVGLVTDIEGHSMLPGHVGRFPLQKPEDGASRLAEMIREFAADPEGRFKRAWEQGGETRDRYGIPMMSQQYEELYVRAGAPRNLHDQTRKSGGLSVA